MTPFRTGIGMGCCHNVECCPQCYPLRVCEDSEGCPTDGVYVSCLAAEWLDKQGIGYTIVYNPQCCLIWDGKTGQEETCEDVLKDGAVVIYSKGDDQPSKTIQEYKTGDCEDCEEPDPDIVGACCYEYRGNSYCVQVTQNICNGAIYNGTYQGDYTCCAGVTGCDPAWEVECDPPPDEVDCTKYAGQCRTIADTELVERCGTPPGAATDCATTYDFNLDIGGVSLSTAHNLNQGWQFCDDGGCENTNTICCSDNMSGVNGSAPIIKEGLNDLWSTQGTSPKFALDGAWHCGVGSSCLPDDCPDEDCPNCSNASGIQCKEITGCYNCPCCSATKFIDWYFYAEIEETSVPYDPLGYDVCNVTNLDSCSVWTVKIDLSFGTNSCQSPSQGCGNCPSCWENWENTCYLHVARMIWKVRLPKCSCPDEVSSNDAHVIAIEQTGVSSLLGHGYWLNGYPNSKYELETCVGACPCKVWIPWCGGGNVAFWADWMSIKRQLHWTIT